MPEPQPQRKCGSCTLCCKLVGVKSLDKPPNKWCTHCDKSGGCKIYESRPDDCREFSCAWLINPSIPEDWYPLKSKMVLAGLESTRTLQVHVDPQYKHRWREEPWHSAIIRLAAGGKERGYRTIVVCGDMRHLIEVA